MTDKIFEGAAATLRRHGLRPRRSLGQNFLDDPAALQIIVDASRLYSDDVVLEIGCGLGSLTRQLARTARRVVAVELDGALVAIAREALLGTHNVEVVQADFLRVAPGELGLPQHYVVAANIPYYVTSPILRHILESLPRPRRIVLTVQKEVAARLCADPPDMSLLAVSVQVHGSVETVAIVPAGSFYPRPDVDSAVVRIECYGQSLVEPALLPRFFRVAKAGFSQPRKMLRNSLAAGLGLATVDAQRVLEKAAIDPRRRAETLSIAEWAQLSQTMHDASR